MRHVVAILNPQSDRGRTATLGDAFVEATRGQLDLRLLRTTRRGEAVELARDAAIAGCDAVVAIGGDGTVHEVANGLMAVAPELRPPLGIVPAGSGNDVAYALGISKDLHENAATIGRTATRAIDVAAVRASDGRSCYCTNNVGTLLEGQVNLKSHELNWPRGSGLYVRAFLQTLFGRLPAAELQLIVDGQSFTRAACILSVGNGPRSGGKFLFYPEATNGDGRFDYIIAPPMGRLRMMWELHKSTRGQANRDGLVEHGQFSHLAVRSSIPLAAHVDGEPWLHPADKVYEIEIEVLPAALDVFVPLR